MLRPLEGGAVPLRNQPGTVLATAEAPTRVGPCTFAAALSEVAWGWAGLLPARLSGNHGAIAVLLVLFQEEEIPGF